MATSAKRLVHLALLAAVVWGLAPGPVSAQPRPAGGGPAQTNGGPRPIPGTVGAPGTGNGAPQAGNNGGINPGFGGSTVGLGTPFPSAGAGMAGPYGMASMTSTPSNPYGGSISSNPYGDLGGYGANPYDAYSYPDPYGGGLRGAADAINAQGKFEIMFQRARLLNQEVQRSQQDTRRKIFDEWLYERANTPTLQDLRERTLRYELRRALTSPDLPDIASGYALNVILKDLEKKPNLASSGAQSTLDPALLKQLNLKPEATAGNVAALKPVAEGGTLNWPLVLQGAAYQDEVRRLNDLAADAVKQVQNNGRPDPAVLNNMLAAVRQLRAKVANNLPQMTDRQQVEANRFLGRLDEAVRALEQPNAADYFTNKFAAQGKTVADLVKYMADSGLVFAPAARGSEAAYAAVHNYLVGYANALRDQGDSGSSGTAGGKEGR